MTSAKLLGASAYRFDLNLPRTLASLLLLQA
jgi:hypothetical protein